MVPHRTWTEHLDLKIARFVGRLVSGPRLAGLIGSGVKDSDRFQKNAHLVGWLGRKMCLCGQNADIFEVRMNLYGSYAVISRSRSSVQVRCGPMR